MSERPGPRYRWVLFDADSTLFDYYRAEEGALLAAFARCGCACRPEYVAAYRQINEQVWLDYERGLITQQELRLRRFERLLVALQDEYGEHFACDAGAFAAHYLEYLAQGSQLTAGADEVVRALHGRVGMLIITNGITEVQRARLAGSPIAGCVQGIVISEEVGAAKPEPAIFDAAFARMGRPPRREVLMVGDSLTSDIRGGNAYGIDTCWFNPEHRPPDPAIPARYEIDDLRALPAIIGLG